MVGSRVERASGERPEPLGTIPPPFGTPLRLNRGAALGCWDHMVAPSGLVPLGSRRSALKLAGVRPSPDGSRADAQSKSPLGHVESEPARLDEAGAALVRRLRRGGQPDTVLRGVVPVVVAPLDAVSRRSRSHVLGESREALPPRVDPNPPPTVPPVLRVRRIQAALPHVAPHSAQHLLRRPLQSPPSTASTALRDVPAHQVEHRHHLLPAAVTATAPSPSTTPRHAPRALHRNQLPESSPLQVQRLLHARPIIKWSSRGATDHMVRAVLQSRCLSLGNAPPEGLWRALEARLPREGVPGWLWGGGGPRLKPYGAPVRSPDGGPPDRPLPVARGCVA